MRPGSATGPVRSAAAAPHSCLIQLQGRGLDQPLALCALQPCKALRALPQTPEPMSLQWSCCLTFTVESHAETGFATSQHNCA